MKKLFIAAAAIMMLAVCSFAQSGNDISFETFSSYFENNNAGLTGDTSYLAFTDQAAFDKIFGSAAVMGKNSFLPDNAFSSKMVVATIKRGPIREYSDVKVSASGSKLTVSYKIKDRAADSATYATPLIIAVKKGKYKEVVFKENGKKVGSVTVTK
jgi:hypothetical protein